MKNKILISVVLISSSLIGAPKGGVAIKGEMEILTNGSRTSIKTSSDGVIHWDTFSIGKNEGVCFIQPEAQSTILNRVVGGQSSEILGSLVSNGQVILVNPHGIYIGPDAHIDLPAFIGSTADLIKPKQDELHFENPGPGTIINLGKIEAKSGSVYLIAKAIENRGSINARHGEAHLISAHEVLIKPKDAQKIFIRAGMQVSGEDHAVINTGEIEALQISIESDGVYASAVKSTGNLRGEKLVSRDGKIYLAADRGKVEVGGKVNSSGELHIVGKNVEVKKGAKLFATTHCAIGSLGEDAAIKNTSVRINEGADLHSGGMIEVYSEGFVDCRGKVDFEDGHLRIKGKEGYHLYNPKNGRTHHKSGPAVVHNVTGAVTFDNSATPGTGNVFGDAYIAGVLDTPDDLTVITDASQMTFLSGFDLLWSEATTFEIETLRNIFSRGNVTVESTNAGGNFDAFIATANPNGDTTGQFTGIWVDMILGDVRFEAVDGNLSFSGRSGSDLFDGDGTEGGILTEVGGGPNSTTIRTTGLGNITLFGEARFRTNTGNIAQSAAGIANSRALFIQATGTGDIELTGIGAPCDQFGGNLLPLRNSGIFIGSNGDDEDLEISSTSGSITLTGTGDIAQRFSYGIQVRGNDFLLPSPEATIRSTSGAISLTGIAGVSDGSLPNDESVGVSWFGGRCESESGDITFTGTGNTADDRSSGVELEPRGVRFVEIITGGSGNILIDGTSAAIAGSASWGVAQLPGSDSSIDNVVTNTGTGSITIEGTGANAGSNSFGFYQDNGRVEATTSGTISINGTSGTVTGDRSDGVHIEDSVTSSTGNITIIGTSGGGATNSFGVFVSPDGRDNDGVASSGGADIAITGRGQSGTNCGGIFNSGIIQHTGVSGGTITLDGRVLSSATGGEECYGIRVTGVNGVVASLGTLSATGETSPNTSNAIQIGILVEGESSVSSSGIATVSGTSSSIGTTDCHGISVQGLNSEITSAENMNATGTGGGQEGNGIEVLTGADIQQTGSTLMTLDGQASLQGTGIGVLVDGDGSLIDCQVAALSLTGRQPLSGSPTGIEIRDEGIIQVDSALSSTVTTLSDFNVINGSLFDAQGSGMTTFNISGNLLVEGGVLGPSVIDTTSANLLFNISNNLTLRGASTPGSFAQIGSMADVAATANLTFSFIGGNVVLDAIGGGSYALIGHGNPSTAMAQSGLITLSAQGDGTLQGATAGGGGDGFAQIGHLSTAGSLSGDIEVSVRGSWNITGGTTGASAIARIGHNSPSIDPSNVLAIAGVSIFFETNAGQAQAVSENGDLTLVTDDLFPSPPGFGSGEFVLGSGSLIEAANELRIYTVQPSQNMFDELIEGTLFVPGPFGVDNDQETYATYFPNGPYLMGQDFHVYYKVFSASMAQSIILPAIADTLDRFVPLFFRFPNVCSVNGFSGTFYEEDPIHGCKSYISNWNPYRSFIFESRLIFPD